MRWRRIRFIWSLVSPELAAPKAKDLLSHSDTLAAVTDVADCAHLLVFPDFTHTCLEAAGHLGRWLCEPRSALSSSNRKGRQSRYDSVPIQKGRPLTRSALDQILYFKMVRKRGLEPLSLSALAPKASVFAISPLPHTADGSAAGSNFASRARAAPPRSSL